MTAIGLFERAGPVAADPVKAGDRPGQRSVQPARPGLQFFLPTDALRALGVQSISLGTEGIELLGQPVEPSDVGLAGLEFLPDAPDLIPEPIALGAYPVQFPFRGLDRPEVDL